MKMTEGNMAIEVQGLSKIYRIGLKDEVYDNLLKTALHFIKSPLSNYRKYRSLYRFDDIKKIGNGTDNTPKDIIWALKDVSFKVSHGEVVGIIGNNGAGKSTLLKILCRITGPTSGNARINGRVSSLLEVGTGFHPELTGRENVYLNGTILGMKKKEIDAKFDEIVDFSEVETFIDTPVKRYSSGMRVRLAFAVAAHLEPEIMLVDEVLAVGDAAFQKKCIGKMQNVAKGGKTILFVSHNMSAVQSLCTRGIVIEKGRLAFDGPTEKAVSKYITSLQSQTGVDLALRTDRKGGENFRFTSVEFLNPKSMQPYNLFVSGQPTLIKIGYRAKAPIDNVGISITFTNSTREHMFTCSSQAIGVSFDVNEGEYFTYCILDKLPLKTGHYSYHLFSERRRGEIPDWIQDAGTLDIQNGDYYGYGLQPAPGLPGVLVDYNWHNSSPEPK